MTPFDAGALVAMLLAFYPVVSPTALARARGERPEYFAAGRLMGSKGDKLALPDGRVWDLIFASGGPPSGMRWQALDVTTDPGSAADPFALEEGPLRYLDEDALVVTPATDSLETAFATELHPLAGTEGALDNAAQWAIEFPGAAALEDAYGADMEPAIAEHVTLRAALDADDPIDILEAATTHDGEIDSGQNDYDEPEPPDAPEPDPGEVPGDDGGKDPDNPPMA